MTSKARTKTKKKAAKKAAKKIAVGRVAALTKSKRLTKAQKLQREIARRNNEFKTANAAQKRVLIAKDVIAQLKAGRYKAASGNWIVPAVAGSGVSARADIERRYEAFDAAVLEAPNKSVRKAFLANEIPTCSCCALGGMFMSCTLYNNKTTMSDLAVELTGIGYRIENHFKLSNGLNKVFAPEQLVLIEIAFEGGNGNFCENDLNAYKTCKHTTQMFDAACRYFDTYTNPQKRLHAIMQNIVANDGTFKP